MRWMELAWADVGLHETAGPAVTSEILQYFRDAGRADITSDEVHWCAAFVASCLARAGIANPIPARDRLLAISYRRIGTQCAPRVGALAIVRRPGGYHVAFIAGITRTHLKLLGGNQSDAVTVISWRIEDLIECRWPAAPASPRDLDRLGSTTTALAARQQGDAAKATAAGSSGPFVPPPAAPVPAVPSPADVATDVGAWAKGLETVQAFAGFVQLHWHYVAVLIAGYYGARMAWTAYQIRQQRAADHNNGAHTGRAEALPELEEMPA